MPVIFSTLSSSNTYQLFDTKNPRQPVLKESVTIEGGTGVQRKNLETPFGVATVITADQLKMLQQNHVFKIHVAEGYIHVDEKENKKPSQEEVEETVEEEMTEKDKGAQDTAEDYKASGKKPPKEEKAE